MEPETLSAAPAGGGAAAGGPVRPLVLVFLLALVAACVNPQGPALLLYPFRYLAARAG